MQLPLGRSIRTMAALAIITGATLPGAAQSRAGVTVDDYMRAERFMGYNTTPLVANGPVRATWLPGDRFWYRNQGLDGSEFFLVDAAKATKTPAFNHAAVAAALTAAMGKPVTATRLPFTQLTFAADAQSFWFDSDGRRWTCDVAGRQCASVDRPATVPNSELSPDGRYAAYIKDWNLWVRDTTTGQDIQLTTDGVENYGYATDNAGWISSDRPVLKWSPDSRKIATFQQDQRKTGDMYLVTTNVGHPQLRAWKYPLPGDEHVTMIERVIIDVGTATVTRLKMGPDQHRSTLCDDVKCGGEWVDVQWSPDGTQVAFVSTSRNHQQHNLRIADAATGAIRDVLEEKGETFLESGNGRVNWRVLPGSNEAIWFSQKDNWGQLYLHDLQSGKQKAQLTTGEGNVTQLLRVDEPARMLYYLGVGKEPGRDPYFRHFYRQTMDGRPAQLLTPEDADHDISLAPSGNFFVDNFSTPDTPSTSVLRDRTGKVVLPLEKMDISRLLATGWKPPMRITVKDRGGVSDLYGLLYRPTNFDPSRKYPIVNNIYPGPQTGSVGSRQFSAARGDTQALAELGFIVVQIDGMGTPWRSKRFHAAYYGNMGDNTLPDQVSGMKQLASRFPWIDIERAGIYGHSGGGFATAAAMFRYPDFFKVGVSQAGNHDNRVYEDDWAEKWQGLLQKNPDGTTNYDNQANQLVAHQLKGKLLLAHGTMDNNVPYYSTLLVVDALIKANKDFDLIIFPNRTHGFGNEPYMVRRRWDYFVRHLLGVEPPAYEMRGAQAPPPVTSSPH
ncbi:MAG TPA: DPP IV N-terminal domain-containing protein [Vicinamibacterales bacterium]|nr:DPP IV N-terminal domain-containing protein [Vicinamibacterales bacterium]